MTWLYGPLQTGADKTMKLPSNSPVNSSRISKSNSFLHKKPILKKRSMSEIMLQRSLSSSSLLKQAAAALQAQQSDGFERRSGFAPMNFASRRLSDHPSLLSSINSSGMQSPGTERKHIHFNEQVEQCIAVEMKGADDEPEPSIIDYDDSSSDDGGIMMKRSSSGRKLPPMHRSSTPRPTNNDSKTIAMLPSTTLKYMEDVPDSHDSAVKHSNGFWNGSRLSPSPSQETLRPSKPSTRILLGDDDEDDDTDLDWQPPSFFSRKDNLAVPQERVQTLRSSEPPTLNGEPSGMRRTPSGMFMPEEELAAASEGLFGKVVDTVNTAKDIAHVIWNVGWRR